VLTNESRSEKDSLYSRTNTLNNETHMAFLGWAEWFLHRYKRLFRENSILALEKVFVLALRDD